jgi:hypothetical protein
MLVQTGTLTQRPRVNYALYVTLAFVIAAVVMIALAVVASEPATTTSPRTVTSGLTAGNGQTVFGLPAGDRSVVRLPNTQALYGPICTQCAP